MGCLILTSWGRPCQKSRDNRKACFESKKKLARLDIGTRESHAGIRSPLVPKDDHYGSNHCTRSWTLWMKQGINTLTANEVWFGFSFFSFFFFFFFFFSRSPFFSCPLPAGSRCRKSPNTVRILARSGQFRGFPQEKCQ